MKYIGPRVDSDRLDFRDVDRRISRPTTLQTYDGITGDFVGRFEWGIQQTLVLNHIASDTQQWPHQPQDTGPFLRGRAEGGGVHKSTKDDICIYSRNDTASYARSTMADEWRQDVACMSCTLRIYHIEA